MKYMWETYAKYVKCDILTYFGTGLRCVYVLLMYTFANLCVLFMPEEK